MGVYGARARVDATTEIDRRTGPLSAAAINVYRSLAAADAIVAPESLLPTEADRVLAREAYDKEIHDAANSLAHASSLVADQGLTADRIASITSQLPVYTGLVGQARALGGARGSDALKEASALMQSTILRRAEALQRSESGHLDAQYRRARSLPVAALTFSSLGLVALGAAQLLLFRRTRRILNVGLALSSAFVVGVLLWSSFAFSISHAHLESSQRHSQSVTDALGLARIAALQARANEVLALVVTGDVTSYETDFSARAQLLARDDGAGGVGGALGAARQLVPEGPSRAQLESAVATTRSWFRAHTEVQKLRTAGRRAEAIASTISRDGGAGGDFNRLDRILTEAVEAEDNAFRRDIRRADRALAGLVVGTGLLSVAAAAAAVWGIGQRLEDYG
ncbi:MAG: hypothetical protein M3450_05590 [Actinomycetota bacterium]|nr:hypothetical protein [Actinomycetota bacterium]